MALGDSSWNLNRNISKGEKERGESEDERQTSPLMTQLLFAPVTPGKKSPQAVEEVEPGAENSPPSGPSSERIRTDNVKGKAQSATHGDKQCTW